MKRSWYATPYALWMLLFAVVPLVFVLWYAFTTPDGATVIPISRVSFGFASGGTEYPMKDKNGVGAGSGAGVKVEPIGFLVIQNGSVRLLNVTPPASGTVDRLIDMAPQVMDRIDQFLDKRKS